jgi:hypothetical protein
VQLVIRKYSSGNSFWAEQWTTSVKSVVAYFITSHLWFLQIGSRSNPKGDGVGPFGLGMIYDSPSWCASVLALVLALEDNSCCFLRKGDRTVADV